MLNVEVVPNLQQVLFVSLKKCIIIKIFDGLLSRDNGSPEKKSIRFRMLFLFVILTIRSIQVIILEGYK